MGSRVLGILVLVLAVIILITTSAFIVREQELALRVQIQEIIGSDYKPGLHFKVPFIDDVLKFDKRVLTRKFDGEQFLTSESQGLTVDYYIKWRISNPEQFFQSTSGGDEGRAESLVGQKVQDGLKNAVAGRTLKEIVESDRQKITGENGGEIDHIEVFGPSKIAHSKNFVLCPGKAYDRSPCGTGTSAKLACLAADGKIKEGEIWRQESIIGSIFEGFVTYEGNWTIPHVKGTAYVNAEATLLLQEGDPFRMGIRG